jgi:predicted transposase/invertase (TIGR01784 family)
MGISRDEAERFRLLGEHKRELDLQSGFVEAERAGERKGRLEGERKGRSEGRLEGERKGKLEGALEIARKLKKRNIPAEQIAEDTGLSAGEIAGL